MSDPKQGANRRESPILTVGERAILIGQYELFALLEKNPNAYKEEIRVLESGYEAEYDQMIFGSINDPLSEEDSVFVLDILNLYMKMKVCRSKASNHGNGTVDWKNVAPLFPGFEGNREAHLLGYATFKVHVTKSFPEHEHSMQLAGTRPDYRKMLALYESWGSPSDLTEEQVTQLLSRF